MREGREIERQTDRERESFNTLFTLVKKGHLMVIQSELHMKERLRNTGEWRGRGNERVREKEGSSLNIGGVSWCAREWERGEEGP